MSQQMSRRALVQAGLSVTGGLSLSFVVPDRGSAQTVKPVFAPNAFIRVDPDNSVTFILGVTEIGQGVFTSLPMLIAEEMEVDLARIRVESAPTDPLYTHPGFAMQMTGGSQSIQSFWLPLRRAGAAARIMLVRAAAETWGIDPVGCQVENGTVVHIESGRRLTYGELTERAARLLPPSEIVLKNPKDFRLIGRPTKRLDTKSKITGKAIFGIDVALPGLLTALVARSPVFGGTVQSFDARKAKAVPGARAVIQVDSGVAVVADGFWSAKKGRDALEISWNEGPLAGLNSEAEGEQYAKLAERPGIPATQKGDVDSAIRNSAQQLSAVYELPYLAHATMEPLNFVADVRPDRCEIWAGTQFQFLDRQAAAKETGLPLEKVQVHTTFAGGGFGRRWAPDSGPVREAIQISRAVKSPVKVIWTREDDIRGGWYRPRSYHSLNGAVDAQGSPIGWHHRIVGQPLFVGKPFADRWARGEIDGGLVGGATRLLYAVPNHYLDVHNVRDGPPVLAWRSVGSSHNTFVVESFLDELAHLANTDPVEYRRRLLRDNARFRAVLDLAAEKAGWGKKLPSGHGLGIALAEFHSAVAQIAEVSVSREGTVKVHRVICAIDCGTVVNPETVRAQMEGGIVFGLSAGLFGEITLSRGRARQSNFHDYPILSMKDMPAIEVHIVPSTEPPRGVGEAGVPALAPAVANAIFAATGRRIRRLPIRAEALKSWSA